MEPPGVPANTRRDPISGLASPLEYVDGDFIVPHPCNRENEHQHDNAISVSSHPPNGVEESNSLIDPGTGDTHAKADRGARGFDQRTALK